MREKEHAPVPILPYRRVQKRYTTQWNSLKGCPIGYTHWNLSNVINETSHWTLRVTWKHVALIYLLTRTLALMNIVTRIFIVLPLFQFNSYTCICVKNSKRNSIIQLVYYDKGYGFIIILLITTLLLVMKSLNNQRRILIQQRP